jgi:hypothetical protein
VVFVVGFVAFVVKIPNPHSKKWDIQWDIQKIKYVQKPCPYAQVYKLLIRVTNKKSFLRVGHVVFYIKLREPADRQTKDLLSFGEVG